MSGNVDKRSVVVAKAVGDERPATNMGVPLRMGGGRLPDGGQGANNTLKMKSIFEGGNSSQVSQVRMASPRPQGRPLAFARKVMGQESSPEAAPPAPPPPPPTNVQEVLVREGGPQGMTRKEASDIAQVLGIAIQSSSEALAAGQTCVGVDGATLDDARTVQAGMSRFASAGNADERLELSPGEIDLIERVVECGMTYDKMKELNKGKTVAFVAGGLLIGAIVLLVMS